MVSNDDFDGKATNLNYFYLHINFEQKYLKPAIVPRWAKNASFPTSKAITSAAPHTLLRQAIGPSGPG